MKKIIIPTSLDVQKIILLANNQYYDNTTDQLKTYKFDLKTLKIESIHYILFMIFRSSIYKLNALNESEMSMYHNEGKLSKNDFYIELPSSTLVRIDRNYNCIMDFLTNKHFNYDNILFRKKYDKGKSYSYCLNYNFINEKFRLIDIKQKSISKHMNEVYLPKVSGSIINRELIALKNDFLNKFSIDFSGLSTQIDSSKIVTEYNSILGLIDYHNGKKWMSLNPEKDGRLHTNFTIMSSKHRKLIRNNKNEEYVEIDIGSCIPYLFCMSIMNASRLQVILHNDHLKDFQSLFDILNNKLIEFNTINLLIEELKELLQALLNNRFYQLFPSLSKIEILSFFFCKNYSKPIIENTIKDTFPNFFYFIQTMKSNEFWIKHYKYPPKYECNELLAHFLFHLESTLILYKISKRVKKSIRGGYPPEFSSVS
ncbi:hypothetical protein HX096_09975 [Empedobacter falsenii]|uniref:hypothetical protein n=1 Tax=Empedobacter falsenii TaxID=343874 RepID=UPI002576544D|nr:hypothetical protein [Empedobacter falsenii]MDM1548178.1 hypothetical protein [Empedobacter falsenii]